MSEEVRDIHMELMDTHPPHRIPFPTVPVLHPFLQHLDRAERARGCLHCVKLCYIQVNIDTGIDILLWLSNSIQFNSVLFINPSRYSHQCAHENKTNIKTMRNMNRRKYKHTGKQAIHPHPRTHTHTHTHTHTPVVSAAL